MPPRDDEVDATDKGGSMSGGKDSQPVRFFTWRELSQLNRPENAHVAVRGKVYDVSKFVSRHPGGMEQIMMGAGRDVTQLFESYHSFDIYKILEKFYVGELIDNEMPVFPERSEFYEVLKRRVSKYFKDNNIDPKIDYWMFLRYFVFFAAANLGWYGTIHFHENYFLAIPSAVVWGIFSALVAMTCTHDASHFAITHKPWVWKAVGCVHDFFHGASMYAWIHQHVLGHHPYTNIDGADPDIVTAAKVLCADVVDNMKFILAHGADPNTQYSNSNRPLHILADLVHLPELGGLLLEAGAVVDARNATLTTPLAIACKANNPFLAKILIEKGADCHARDVSGKRPFEYIKDHEEWIDSGHFSDDTRALLKAFGLRQTRDLVRTITKTVHTKNIK